MRLRNKTARNLLLAAILVALGAGLLLSPWLILRFRLWREAPGAEVLWTGSLPLETYGGETPWLMGQPTLYARDGDELLSCHMSRYENRVSFSGVGRDPWPGEGETRALLSSDGGYAVLQHQEPGVLGILAAFSPPEGAASARATVTFPDGTARTAEGTREDSVLFFRVPGTAEELAQPHDPVYEGLLRAALQVTYFDKDGTVLLTWDGPVELW